MKKIVNTTVENLINLGWYFGEEHGYLKPEDPVEITLDEENNDLYVDFGGDPDNDFRFKASDIILDGLDFTEVPPTDLEILFI